VELPSVSPFIDHPSVRGNTYQHSLHIVSWNATSTEHVRHLKLQHGWPTVTYRPGAEHCQLLLEEVVSIWNQYEACRNFSANIAISHILLWFSCNLIHYRPWRILRNQCHWIYRQTKNLNDSLIEKALLLIRGTFLSAKATAAKPTAALLPVDYFKMTLFRQSLPPSVCTSNYKKRVRCKDRIMAEFKFKNLIRIGPCIKLVYLYSNIQI